MAQSRVKELEGNELADDYVRTEVPKGRWADGWQVFKSNLVKIIIINVLTLLFFVPSVVLVYFRITYVAQLGIIYPFSANVFALYPFTPNIQGVAENLVLNVDLMFMAALIATGLIASVGIAGASYSLKKLLVTHGKFTVKGYFHGVKVCYLNVVVAVTVFLAFVYAAFVISDWCAAQIAVGASAGGPITAKVFIIIATVLIGIYAFWFMAVGVSYRVKPKYLFKNSFVLLFGTIIQTLFMLGFSLIPVWFLLIGMNSKLFLILAFLIFISVGFSFIFFCWYAYTQWVFDQFITPAIKTEKEAKRAQMSEKELAEEKLNEEKAVARELLAAGRSELIGKPMRPIDEDADFESLPLSFGRADVARAGAARGEIAKEVSEYYETHKNDARYVEYEKMFAEREKALQPEKGKKGKKQRVGSDKLLK